MWLRRIAKTALVRMFYALSVIAFPTLSLALPYNVLSEDASVAQENLEFVAVDYCYAGSETDPTTGETLDVYVVCAGDGLEQNLDLA